MKDLCEVINKYIKLGESIVAATIFNTSGSSPRTSGAKMIILEDGSIFGTIGGGRLEADVQKKAEEVLKKRQSEIMEFSLKGMKDTDMICGGDVQVLVEYIDASEEQTVKVYEETEKSIRNKGKAFFITEFTEFNKNTLHYLVRENEHLNFNKNLDPKILEVLKKDDAKYRSLKFIAFNDKMFIIEPVSISDAVYIFGAGHVSQKLADLTKLVDFETFILDDREEFANKSRFPFADKVIVLNSFDEPFENISINKDSYLVIVTRGHEADLKVLRQALRSNTRYIGMIGSKKKRAELFSRLEKEGFTSEDFNRVHCPIGIEIYAETPEEIAVSITAELIKERAEK